MTEAIESATLAHAGLLAAIHQSAFPAGEAWGADAIGLQLALPGTFGLLASAGGMLIGRVAADEAEILTLAVTPSARRRGVATALLEAAFERFCAQGAARLFLEVGTDNAPAQALYRRLGFADVGRRRRYYADGSDAVVMARDIRGVE